MTRKSALFAIVAVAVLAGGALLIFFTLLRHEPEFYHRAQIPPGIFRQKNSRDFEKRAFDLFNETQHNTKWEAQFSDQEVNSYLAEDFIRTGVAKELPPEISEPRIVFRPGRILLAFRYGADGLNSIVSVEAKVWILQSEANAVGLEIETLRAGALPLAQKVIEDHLSDAAHALNIGVQWFRNGNNPVAILRFQADKREPGFQLQALELKEGSVYLKGRSLDPDVRRAAENTLGLRPPSD